MTSIHSFADFYKLKIRMWILVAFSALFCLPYAAFALGFGAPVIESHLHEPLKAYVPLMLAQTEDIRQVTVELATPAEYRRLGLPWYDSATAIRVLLPRTTSAETKVILSTVGAVTSPMLSIVLKASATGRSTWFRHFRILLDPAAVNVPAGNRQQASAVLPVAETRISPEQQSAAGWARIWRYGPVRAGDSLSEIAYRLRKDKRWSNRQVMLSLYEQNPGSFIARDIHRLKSGAWLSVPSAQIVRKNGSRLAMAKLDRLIQLKAESGAKKTAVATDKKQPAGGLRYSGLIAVKKAIGSSQAETVADSGSGSQMANLEAIHSAVMSSKLQMDQLGKTVAGLGKSMAGLKVDMKALRQEVVAGRQAPAALKQEIAGLKKEITDMKKSLAESMPTPDRLTADSAAVSLSGAMLKNYWALAFFVLLTACLGFLIGSVYQRRKRQGREEPETAGIEPARQAADPFAPTVQPEDATSRMLNDIEASLSRCEYEQAEQALAKLQQLAPDSLKASVLHTQLYHETGRLEQRDKLIGAMNEESDENRWEQFCHQLPAHVWNACFGDGSPRPESPQSDDSGVRQT